MLRDVHDVEKVVISTAYWFLFFSRSACSLSPNKNSISTWIAFIFSKVGTSQDHRKMKHALQLQEEHQLWVCLYTCAATLFVNISYCAKKNTGLTLFLYQQNSMHTIETPKIVAQILNLERFQVWINNARDESTKNSNCNAWIIISVDPFSNWKFRADRWLSRKDERRATIMIRWLWKNRHKLGQGLPRLLVVICIFSVLENTKGRIVWKVIQKF